MTPKDISKVAQRMAAEEQFIPTPKFVATDLSALQDAVRLFRDIVFNRYFGTQSLEDNISTFLTITAQLCARKCRAFNRECESYAYDFGWQVADTMLEQLPELRHKLSTDVKAMFDGDPAAESLEEIILCYPGLSAILYYRLAHALLQLDVPILPRMITEMAHSCTGIDIHPGADIGEYFSIDHGTGVVIGETCIIGRHVRLYQGVTLGAKNFKYDDSGRIIREPRHPILEDRVVVYSNSSILGRVRIGHDTIIGGNVWQTTDLPPYSCVLQGQADVQRLER